MLNDDIGIKMKYPSLDLFINQNMQIAADLDDIFDLAAQCLEAVYDTEEYSH